MYFVNLFARAANVHREPQDSDKEFCCFTYAVEATSAPDAIQIVREHSESEMYRSGWRDFLYNTQASDTKFVFIGVINMTEHQVNQHFSDTK